jgi:hypothetical protein
VAKLLMIVSSARTVRLADGTDHPTGYRAEEVRKPYETFVAAGVDVVIATPDGRVRGRTPGASSRSSIIRRWMRTLCSRCCAGSPITPTACG